MEVVNNKQCNPTFNEEEWLRLLFLLSDTQNWLDEMTRHNMMQVPINGWKKLFRKTYYISVTALAHIFERHYYKIQRHPQAGKFTLSISGLLVHLRDASALPLNPVSGSLNFERVKDAGEIVGFDCQGVATTYITILTDSGGKIVTAFPGRSK